MVLFAVEFDHSGQVISGCFVARKVQGALKDSNCIIFLAHQVQYISKLQPD